MKLAGGGLLALALMVGSSVCVAQTWQFSDTYCTGAYVGSGCDGYDTWRTYGDDGGVVPASVVRVEGWSINLASHETNPTFVQATYSTGGVDDFSAALGIDNGQGEDSNEGGAPEHAIDNSDRRDFLLLAYDSKWILETVELAWTWNDADLTVLYYAGAAAPLGLDDGTLDNGSGVLSGVGYDDIGGPGDAWQVLGHYGTSGACTGCTIDLQNDTIASSYWLVGTYTPELAGTCYASENGSGACSADGSTYVSYNGTYYEKHADFVKIAGVTGTGSGGDSDGGVTGTSSSAASNGEVPEPATWGLLALGLPLLVRRRRARV